MTLRRTMATLPIPLALSCAFQDGLGIVPRCNGTAITPAFIQAQAAAQGLPVASLPGTAPFFNFGCVEAGLVYSVGSVNGSSSIALTLPIPGALVNVRAYDFTKLSDASGLVQVCMCALICCVCVGVLVCV
jgi:hypothetical protein